MTKPENFEQLVLVKLGYSSGEMAATVQLLLASQVSSSVMFAPWAIGRVHNTNLLPAGKCFIKWLEWYYYVTGKALSFLLRKRLGS